MGDGTIDVTAGAMKWAQGVDVGENVQKLHSEAARRGHAKQTAFAGVGGLLGGLLGSFRGPVGAAFGGLLGALLGALLGRGRDQRLTSGASPRAALPAPAQSLRVVPRARAEYVDVCYRDR